MFAAQRRWFSRLGEFAQHFRYQYVLSKDEESIEGFQHQTIGEWNLYTGKALPVSILKDARNQSVGYVLGIAVGPNGAVVDEAQPLPFSEDDSDFWRQLENYIVETAGRFAFLVEHDGESRLYTDPVGMIGAVYSEKDQKVAASTLLCIKREVEFNPLFDPEMIREHGGKFSLFHTADRHVKRLNPNHFLDLKTLSEHRFWPKSEDFSERPKDVLATYDEIYSRAANNLAAIAQRFPCSQPVSGGQDSRLLLSFAKSNIGAIDQFYTHINNWATKRDALIAGHLCGKLGADHSVHDKADFSVNRKDARRMTYAFQTAVGAEMQPPKEYLNGVINGVPEGNVIMRGHQTDFLRAVFVFRPKKEWRDPAWQIERLLITPRKLFSEEVATKFTPEFLKWQDSLPANAMEKAADFMFLEIYYNSTVGTVFPALWRNFYLSPFNSRKLIGLSLQFSERDRRTSKPVFDIIERKSPELSPVPFDFECSFPIEDLRKKSTFDEATKKRRDRTNLRLESY